MKRLVDGKGAMDCVMSLLRLGGVSGSEKEVARAISKLLKGVGRLRHDRANARIPEPTSCGNLVCEIPGGGKRAREKPILFSAHMDKVPTAAGAVPVLRGSFIRPKGKTGLGADDRSGCAALVTMARTVRGLGVEHPPLVLLFTVREETGLWGARFSERALLKRCRFGYNLDGSDPATFVVGAPSSDKFTIRIRGRASHAGAAPEKGVNASTVFARAVASLAKGRWLGKVKKGSEEGTSNIGVVKGGDATNIVMASLVVEAEARSYSQAFLDRIVSTFRKEFEKAARSAKNSEGVRAKVTFERSHIYTTFDLPEKARVVARALRAAESLGMDPALKKQFGGLDANWFNGYGLPTLTLGAGGRDAHTVGERLDVKKYLDACELMVRLATGED